MRLAIFSDIHANKKALETIINDIKKENIDEIICLGDSIGVGSNPSECLDLLINNNVKTVLGNHELYCLKGPMIDDEMTEEQISHQNWTREQIKDYQKEYLENSPMTIEREYNGKKILFEHFPIDYDTDEEYPFHSLRIVRDKSIREIVRAYSAKNNERVSVDIEE